MACFVNFRYCALMFINTLLHIVNAINHIKRRPRFLFEHLMWRHWRLQTQTNNVQYGLLDVEQCPVWSATLVWLVFWILNNVQYGRPRLSDLSSGCWTMSSMVGHACLTCLLDVEQCPVWPATPVWLVFWMLNNVQYGRPRLSDLSSGCWTMSSMVGHACLTCLLCYMIHKQMCLTL